MIKAGEIPSVPFPTKITDSRITKWYLAADRSLARASTNLFTIFQHITPHISVVETALNPVLAGGIGIGLWLRLRAPLARLQPRLIPAVFTTQGVSSRSLRGGQRRPDFIEVKGKIVNRNEHESQRVLIGVH